MTESDEAAARREVRRQTWTGQVFRCGEAEREAFVAAVEAGLADIAAGRVLTHAQVLEAMQARFGDLSADRATLTSMSDEASRILEAAMRLPDVERAALAVVLKDSVGDGASPDEVEAVWIAEAERELEDLRAGRTTTVPWEEVRRELFDMVERESLPIRSHGQKSNPACVGR
jgi:putative addiction module component (TIGR02574 family)